MPRSHATPNAWRRLSQARRGVNRRSSTSRIIAVQRSSRSLLRSAGPLRSQIARSSLTAIGMQPRTSRGFLGSFWDPAEGRREHSRFAVLTPLWRPSRRPVHASHQFLAGSLGFLIPPSASGADALEESRVSTFVSLRRRRWYWEQTCESCSTTRTTERTDHTHETALQGGSFIEKTGTSAGKTDALNKCQVRSKGRIWSESDVRNFMEVAPATRAASRAVAVSYVVPKEEVPLFLAPYYPPLYLPLHDDASRSLCYAATRTGYLFVVRIAGRRLAADALYRSSARDIVKSCV